MSNLTEEAVLERLSRVNDPELHRDLVSLKMVKEVHIEGSKLVLTIELTTPACPLKDKIEKDIREALADVEGLEEIEIKMTARVRSGSDKQPIPGVKHVILVGSGKGGVGKSTVAVNTALALEQTGATVGLMDADVYGPNIPTMLSVYEPKDVLKNKILPAEKFGIKIVSMGFFLNPEEPVIWRGPMLHSAVRQFLNDVDWGELDYLVVDLPPGTGDVQLSLAQAIPVTGAVVVATPQKVAIEDAAKAIGMFKKVNIPVLGLVENMSYLPCPHCDEVIDLYGRGGVEKIAVKWGQRFLGAIPIDATIREGGDEGRPAVTENTPTAEAFRSVARNVAGEISTIVLSKPKEISLDNLVLG